MADAAELEGNVRRFLEGVLSPQSLQYVDGLIARIEAEVDDPQPAHEGESTSQQDMMVALREFLESQLDDAQMQMLDQLISEVDSGEQDQDAREEYTRSVQARQGGAAGAGQEETGNMNTHAMDEMRDLRRRLRANGCPVGDQNNLGALRTLARTYLRPGLATDSRLARPDLSLGRLFPKIAARFAKAGPGSFAVYPDRERQRAAASDRAMAFDSRPSDDPRLSIERMFPRLGHLWNRAG